MKTRLWIIAIAAGALLAGQASAQSQEERQARELAQRQAELAEAAKVEAEAEGAVRSQEAEVMKLAEREAEVERELREAEERMAEAARRISELTTQRLPNMQQFERRFAFIGDDKPRLGVMIGAEEQGPVEGVRIVGVTPGTAAAEAGLRSGDVITSINDESLSATDSATANQRLLDFMQGIEEGDVLDVEYLRDGKVGKVEVEPKAAENTFFAFSPDGGPMRVPGVPNIQVMPKIAGDVERHFVFDWTSAGWADMELVELNEGLGRYFGTDEGLLVVSAPNSKALQLEDGDVIQKIDGRTPSSVRHAMRILGSYQAGEKLTLEIMREKKRRKLDVEIPDDRSSMLAPGVAPVPRPAAMPAPAARPARPVEKT
jgi:C-terminal processing protease CtpA/Prc